MELPEWNGLEILPNKAVRSFAVQVSQLLTKEKMVANRIIPSIDGEIVFYFFTNDLEPKNLAFVSITCTEDGDIIVTQSKRPWTLSVQQFTANDAGVQSAIEAAKCLLKND